MRVTALFATVFLALSAAATEPFVRMNDRPEMVPAIKALRAADVLVDVEADSHPNASPTKDDYAVICLGARVPAAFAINVLKRALPLMPWIKYVFIQDDPQYASMIHMSGHVDWVPYKKLRPLTKQDFDKVMKQGQSDQAFRELIRSFAGVEAQSR